MGTAISVELWSDDRAEGEAAIAAVMDEMHRIDRVMSPHKPDSELSRINRDAAFAAVVALSAEMARLLARAQDFAALSGGAFDITYAAVGQLYDYRQRIRPSDAALSRARALVGWRNLILDPNARTVRFALAGMRIDLGGFAKGHAVDNATKILRARGIRHANVSAGGDSRVHRRPPRPAVDDRRARSAPPRRDGRDAAARRRLDLDLGRLRALLRCRRRAPSPPDRPGHRPLAEQRAQRDRPRRGRPDDRGAVEVRVRARRRKGPAADRVASAVSMPSSSTPPGHCITPRACSTQTRRRGNKVQRMNKQERLDEQDPDPGTVAPSRLALAARGACGSGTSSESSTVTVAGDVPIAYAMRVNTIGMNPTNGGPTAPGGDLMIREKSSASATEHNITAQFTQGKGDATGARGLVRRQEDRVLDALPDLEHLDDRRPARLHRPLEHLGIRHDGRRADRRHVPPHHQLDRFDDDVEPAYLPAGQGYVFTSNRQTKSNINQALGHSYFALDEYERERVFNLHTMDAKGANVAQISFNQSHDRSPVMRPERRHHVLALGPRRRPQPLQGVPRQARRHRPVRAVRRAQRGQQLPAPARHGPEGQVRGLPRLRPDAAVAHPRRRRAGVHRRRQLLRAEHARQRRRADHRRPDPGDRAGAELRRRRVAIRPHHDAVPAVGRHRPRAGLVHAVRSDPRRRRRRVRDADGRRDDAPGRRQPPGRRRARPTSCRTTCRRRTRSTCSTRRSRPS